MILRKPYAFLIKNFRKINIVLFLLVAYIFYMSLSIYGFTKDYLNTGTYNTFNSISAYVSTFYLFICIFIILLSGILIYLLKYKDKPIKVYIFSAITYLGVLITSIYFLNYFSNLIITGYDLEQARNIKDIAFIMTIPQYPLLLLMLIRAIGLDLKSFGFSQDKDLLANEEDREEIEINTTFDKDKYIRKIKKALREAKYFILEKKTYLVIAFVLVFLFSSFSIYKNVYSVNRLYPMSSSISSNYYTFQINHAYITNRDYKGDQINNSYFVILDLDIKNELNSVRNLDISKFMLFVGEDYYVPTTEYNQYFVDMGNLFSTQQLSSFEKANYLLVYEIKEPLKNDNFLLRYQQVAGRANLIRIKLKVQDISSYIKKGSASVTEEMTIPFNLNESQTLKVNTFELRDSITYTYEKCYVNNCPIYENTLTAPSSEKYLYMKVENQSVLNFIKKYGKLKYVIDNKEYFESIQTAFSGSYRGNHLYLKANRRIQDASSIEFVFTVRSYQYFYKLK